MSTQYLDHRRVADTHGDPRPTPAAVDTTTQLAQESMVQLVRQGQDVSLRSLQVWADLARKLGPTELSATPGVATIVSLAHDPFEKLLEAQRQVVDELVATQRQLARQVFLITATIGDTHAPR